jgi:putative aminopeptidase FrvX
MRRIMLETAAGNGIISLPFTNTRTEAPMPDQILGFLMEATAVPGLPGFEKPAADLIAKWFGKHSPDVWQDPFYNTFARMGGRGPKALVAAHADGLGLMALSVEEDGFIGFTTLGGFDPRVLPGMEVTVHGRQGDYYGVIGAKPPHVLSEEDRGKVLAVADLFIDIGYAGKAARRLVSPGDIISLRAPLHKLSGDAITGRALDDRAGVAVMLEAMRILRKHPCQADAVFAATSREEVGGYGAETSAYALDPALAVIIDVTHAAINKKDDPRMVPFDRVCLSAGPRIDRRLRLKMEQTAKRMKLEYSTEVMPGGTGTDGDTVHTSRAGVPIVLLQIPLRYMHTTVECVHEKVVASAGKLLAAFLGEITASWEEWPCM